jgi:hypothetical protein
MRFGGIDGGVKVGSMVVEGSTPSLSPPRRCWRRRINDTGTVVVEDSRQLLL